MTHAGRGRPSTSLLADAVLLVLVVAGGFIAGQQYIRAFVAGGGQPQFYQDQFDAVLMEVCGHGFVRPHPTGEHPALRAFLTLQADTFTCDQLGAGMAAAPPDTYQRVSRYFLESAGIIWRISGISWHSLVLLGGLLFSASAAAAYILFRVGMNQALAFLLTFLFASSAGQLQNLPHLRDYSKAPFVIAVIAVSGWIVSRRWQPPGLRALAVAAGAIVGVGLGFRTDLLIMVVPASLALLMAAPAEVRPMRVKAEAFALFAGTFVLTAFPILRAYAAGNNIWHVIVLGLTDPFDARLGVSSTFYSIGPFYNDSYINVTINSYAHRVLGETRFLPLDSKGYEIAGWRFFRELITTLPGDAMTRACAAIVRVLRLPADASASPPMYLHSARVLSAYVARTDALGPLGAAMPFLAGTALAVLGGINLRIAAWWAFAVFFFAGTPALQFDLRHFFHLEVLGWLALGFLVERFLRLLLPRAWRREHLRSVPARAGRGLALVAVVGGVLLGTMRVTRAIQDSTVRHLVDRYRSAELEPLDILSAPGTNGGIAVHAPPANGEDVRSGTKIRTEYLVAELDAACAFESVPLRVEYRASAAFVDFSQTISAPIGAVSAGSAYAYFPVYTDAGGQNNRGNFSFERLTVPSPAARCVRRVSRVKDIDDLPVLFQLELTPDWRRQPAHETIEAHPNRTITYIAPPGTGIRRNSPQEEPAFARPEGVEFVGDLVTPTGTGAVKVEGTASGPYAYLIRTRSVDRPDGTAVLIEGELREGGFTAGLLENEKWVLQLTIADKGRFRILFNPTTGGRFALVLANYLPGSKRTSFTIDRAVWLPPPGQAATAR